MERAALGLSPGLRTPPTRSRRRTPRWGQAIEARTWNYSLNIYIWLILQSVVHSQRATSRRTAICGSLDQPDRAVRRSRSGTRPARWHEARPTAGSAHRPSRDLVPGTDDAPERRVEALAPEVTLRPRLEVARRVVPVVRERLLVHGVELERITLRVERDDAQSVRPLGCGWRRLELDP